MKDNEQQPAPITEASAPEVAERPLWELSRDEQRVLIITFVGGLASIVAGACVIGAAIALDRVLKLVPSFVAVMSVFTVLYIGLLVWFVKHRITDWIQTLVFCLGFGLLLLFWIGVAAGIH